MTTSFNYLGTWDSAGRPNYLVDDDEITPDYLKRINTSLPELGDVAKHSPQYLTNTKSRNILVKTDNPEFDGADIYVTFITEGAGYRNVFGYYWYELRDEFEVPTIFDGESYRPMRYNEVDNLDGDGKYILHKTIVFPNASLYGSGGSLRIGNRVKILYDPKNPDIKFPNNTGIGFFLIPNGWDSRKSAVSITPNIVYTDNEFNLHDAISTDGYIQTILLQDLENSDINSGSIILGIEDIMRPNGDKDFNDLVLKIEYNPGFAYDNSKGLTVSPDDPITKTSLVADSTGLYLNFTNEYMFTLNKVDTDIFIIKHRFRKSTHERTRQLKIVLDKIRFQYETVVEYDDEQKDENGNSRGLRMTYRLPKISLNRYVHICRSVENQYIPSDLDPDVNNIVYFQNDYVFESDIDEEYVEIYSDKDIFVYVINGRPDTSRMKCPLAMGDPHFTTITGKKYTLPHLLGNFTLLKNDHIRINTFIDFYPKNIGKDILSKLTFMKYIFISYKNQHIVIDLFEKNSYLQYVNGELIPVNQVNSPFVLVKDEDNSKIIELATNEMGKIEFQYNYFLDELDKINEFSVKCNGIHLFKAQGLLVSPMATTTHPKLDYLE